MRLSSTWIAVAVLSAAGLAAADLVAAGELAIGVGRGDQRVPLASYDGGRDGYLAVWLDVEPGTIGSRTVLPAPSGATRLGRIQRRALDAFPEALAYNPHRREHVLLSSDGPFEQYEPLRATRFAPNGRARGEPLLISTQPGCGAIDDADLVYVPSRRRWLVVWGEENCGLKARWLRGKRLELDGAEWLIQETPFLGLPEPSLAYSPTSDEILLVYRDPNLAVQAIRMDRHGRRLSASTIAPYSQTSPIALPQPRRDGWLVVWSARARVWSRLVLGDGSLGDLLKIASPLALTPAAAYNSFADRVLVTWAPGNFGIIGRWYRPSSAPAGRRLAIGGQGAVQPTWSMGNTIACSERRRHCLVLWEKQLSGPPVEDDVYGEIVVAR